MEGMMEPYRSSARSAQYGVICPVCGAKTYEPCRTLKTNRVTDTHLARIEAAWQARFDAENRKRPVI